MRLLKTLLVLLPITAASQEVPLKKGIWRASLQLKEGLELPFSIEVKGNTIEVINDTERIRISEIRKEGDSLYVRMPVFDSEIIAKAEDGTLTGYWYNYSRKTHNKIPFRAEHGRNYRFSAAPGKPEIDVSGRWETKFSPGTADSSMAIGVFRQNGNSVSGTFLTPTGDYRYLQGEVSGRNMMLSCFDGSHAFLFSSSLSDEGLLKGTFWSGSHWSEPWTAKKNETYKLPDPGSLTYLKSGYDRLSFTFLSLGGDSVSLSDRRFRNKVVVVQIMGSWCPNCMDETVFLSGFYKKNKSRGIEIIGLAYEKTNDVEKAKANIKRLKERFDVEYPLLLAGTSNKADAAKTLPMLNHIMSFPTTIFIDRKGKVRRIHTGFSGPATGSLYDRFREEFSDYIDKLAGEN